MKADKSISSGSGKADESGDVESRPMMGTRPCEGQARKIAFEGMTVSNPEEGTDEEHMKMPANSGVMYPKK